MIMTPMKPATTAAHRRQPTLSLRKRAAAIVIASGCALLIAGLLLLITVAWPAPLKAAVGATWGGLTLLRLAQLARAYARNMPFRA